MRLKQSQNEQDAAMDLALKLMGFLAQDEERFDGFLAITGLGPGDFAARLKEPTFLAMVMDYALQDQSLILEFAAHEGLKPEAMMRARSRLPGFTES